jgi:hypothetical protein
VTNVAGRNETLYISSVRDYFRQHEMPDVTRRKVTGLRGISDLIGFPPDLGLLHCEVKTGHYAALAGDEQVRYWMDEAERRCSELGLDHVLLVVKRRRVGDVRYQWAVTREYGDYGSVMVRTTLEDWTKRYTHGYVNTLRPRAENTRPD